YLLTSSHLDAFATGALVSLAAPKTLPRHALMLWFAAVALAYALGAWVNGPGIASFEHYPVFTLGYPIHMDRGYQYVWGYTVINLLAGAMLRLAVREPTARRVFTLGFLRYTGKISYGMYIIHLPLILLMQQPHGLFYGATGQASDMIWRAPAYVLL